MPIYRGEFVVGHPAFPKDSQVKNTEGATPKDHTAPKIVYTSEDDKAIDDFHRQNGTCYEVCEMSLFINLTVATSWHSVRGTRASSLRVTDTVTHTVRNLWNEAARERWGGRP